MAVCGVAPIAVIVLVLLANSAYHIGTIEAIGITAVLSVLKYKRSLYCGRECFLGFGTTGLHFLFLTQ